MALSTKKKVLILLALVLGAFGLLAGFAVVSTKTLAKLSPMGGGSESVAFDGKSGNLAVLEINGVIMDPKETLKKIRELAEKTEVKAVVVRVNSPGGAVGPTQEILAALRRLGKDKSLVCSFGDIAASGGYYVAMACPKIVSNAGTLTGSIGVIMHFINFRELYDWAKVNPYILKAGRFKDIGSEARPMTEDERRLLQEMLDNVHAQFKSAVREARKLDPAVVDGFADGRIFSGEQAKHLGFVDEIGDEQVAIDLAAAAAKISGKPKVIREDSRRDRFSRFFDSKVDDAVTPVVESMLSRVAPQLQLQPGVPYLLPAHMFAGGAPVRSR